MEKKMIPDQKSYESYATFHKKIGQHDIDLIFNVKKDNLDIKKSSEKVRYFFK